MGRFPGPLPGYGLPLNFKPTREVEFSDVEIDILFPNALDPLDLESRRTALRLTPLRELTMLRLMNHLTDKSNWHQKVFNEKLVAKFRSEVFSSNHFDITENMFDWCIEELKWKAQSFDSTPGIIVYDAGVIKSDTAIPDSLRQSLREAVKVLEDVPDHLKDWHPGSDEQVLDIIHPSLFPLIYGRSRILEEGLVGLDDCIELSGQGTTIPIPQDSELAFDSQGNNNKGEEGRTKPFSKHFQWLPCDVKVYGNYANITSYINNLHPFKHDNLYWVIEQIITYTIPLWNMTLTSLVSPRLHPSRIVYESCQYDPDPENGPIEEGPQREDGENEWTFWRRRREWYKARRRVVQPEPGKFKPPAIPKDYLDEKTGKLKREYTVDICRDYAANGIQVIVKLANIHLTPENPEYPGGSWHVEGQLNEHICASAVYYYDSENITTSRLSFRQQASSNPRGISYPQDHHDWLSAVFGCEQHGSCIQELGSVITSERRLLTWPNILQHQVQPFKLADSTKPGHRKILALFLVDPNIRIISTSNIPCQRVDWQSGACQEADNIVSDNDFPISLEDAKNLRIKLMEERRTYVEGMDRAFQQHEFSLCEH